MVKQKKTEPKETVKETEPLKMNNLIKQTIIRLNGDLSTNELEKKYKEFTNNGK